jgi:hypothetical protein
MSAATILDIHRHRREGSGMSHQGPNARRALRNTGLLAAAMATFLAFGGTTVSAAGPGPQVSVLAARGTGHLHGAHGGGASASKSSNLLFHNGQILTSTVVRSIFWGTTWNVPGDKISGLDTFYGGVGGSAYLNTTTEYTGTNGRVGSGVTYKGSLVDYSAGPTTAPSATTILAEVARTLAAHNITPVANGFYPVYVDLPRGSAGYCAWHSYGTIGAVPVQFGFFFKLDGDPGCDPGDTVIGHSQGLAALANVSGHELSETVTDPRNGGWWDRQGAENSDKCAWTFGGNVTIGGQSWKIQGNWSNKASNSRSGYDHAGCIQTS